MKKILIDTCLPVGWFIDIDGNLPAGRQVH